MASDKRSHRGLHRMPADPELSLAAADVAAASAALPAVTAPVSVRFQASNPHACTYLDTHAFTLVPHAHNPFAGLRHPTRSGVFPSTSAATSTTETPGGTSTTRARRPTRPASTAAAPASPTRTWSHRSTSTGSRSPPRTLSGANRRVAAVGAWQPGGPVILPASPRIGLDFSWSTGRAAVDF